ncbi:MAG: hypothetical protein ACRDTC_02880 [Pseudonocardiaceae bacterium]
MSTTKMRCYGARYHGHGGCSLSHTSELRRFPAHRSFVDAAERAVTRAGEAISDMAYFTVRNHEPGQMCREAVRATDIADSR